MRRTACVLLVLLTGACSDEVPVDRSGAPEADAAAAERERAHVGDAPVVVEPPAAPEGGGDEPPRDRERAQELLGRLSVVGTRESAEAELRDLPEAERIALLRDGLTLSDDLALEAAKRLEHFVLDADESERFVALLLPHLFDEEDEIDFEELRSALGSSEIGAVLQEMREHEAIAGERSLLGALHRQLRAEHLPALVEMALSRNPALAEQAFEEIAIVAMYTNRHRQDVARIFAGRAEVPERLGSVPAELAVALRAILADDAMSDVRRSMFLAWALRWLRDIEPVRADHELLRELLVTSRSAPGIGAWERDNVQICAVLGLVDKDERWLRREYDENADAWKGDAALALRTALLVERGETSEARSLAGAVPLVLAVLLELDAKEGSVALVEALDGRKAHAALDYMDDVYSARFRFRMTWPQVRPHTFLRPQDRARLDPALMLRLAALYTEFDGRPFIAPFLARLAEPGGLARSAAGSADLHDGVLPTIEGDALRELLREKLAQGTPADRREAARLLALLRDRPTEALLIDAVLAGRADEGVLADVAEWATQGGKERIRAWLPADEPEFEMQTLAALGGLPRGIARRFGEEAAERLRNGAERSADVVDLLREGDAVGALLLHLEVNRHDEIDGIGRIDDPRMLDRLRAWAARREDGRAYWALGELALAGDAAARAQIADVVRAGRYRWVDDAAAEVLLLGGGDDVGFWVTEAESNCCRAVPVKRVFEDALRVNVTEEMNFQAGLSVTLAEWLRWRLGVHPWRLTDGYTGRLGRPESVRGLVWSDIADGYVPALR